MEAVAMEPSVREEPWPEGVTRIPYWLYQKPDIYRAEQQRLFRGDCWNYLCLAGEIPNARDFCTSYVGDTPVIVTRDTEGEIHGFENRCAHRGALLALGARGTARHFTCIYHAWTYNLQGDLIGVAFRNGLNGAGGMRASFCMSDHRPRKLRIATIHGLVFGSFSDASAPLEDYLGEPIVEHIGRLLADRTPVVLGRFTQALPNNWKLYMENVKDSYHASILHLFFTTFEINHLSQRGAILVSAGGGNHISYSAIDRSNARTEDYSSQQIRSANELYLEDPSILDAFPERDDDITLQILSIFPGFVLQQIQNSIAVRQVLPRGTDRTDLNWTYLGFAEDSSGQQATRLAQANFVGPAGYISMEDGCVGGFIQRGIAGAGDQYEVLEMGGDAADSSSSRVTEASVRGFWKAYREVMAL
jgi:anthranilate 1,2-dioxygenase large subunit